MRTRSRSLTTAACTFALAVAAAPVAARQDAPDAITIGQRFTLRSEILGEERAYWVYLPGSYGSGAFTDSYPVLYLLDGQIHFHAATGLVQHMASTLTGNIQIPELIVVAIASTRDRTRDMTPTHTTRGPDGRDAAWLRHSGGGDRFLAFLREELFPHIEATYRTRPYRVIAGHSLGGLLALHALLAAPDMFHGYIAIDPSLWWNDQVLVRRATADAAGLGARRGAVHISLANNPSVGGIDPALMRRAGEAFSRALESAASGTFRPKLQYFAQEDHGSVPLQSLYHGLLHVFHGYKPPLEEAFARPGQVATHFRQVSEQLGVELLPPAFFVNELGYSLLQQLGDVDGALTLFRLNVANHPASWRAHQSLGEGYEAAGQLAQARRCYEKALQLRPQNEDARRRLIALLQR